MNTQGKRIELIIGGRNIIANIYTTEKGAYAGITEICEAIGIDRATQANKLKSDPKFNPRHMPRVGADGKQREMLFLPVEEVGLWLCGINSRKALADVAPILLTFQKHCQVELHAAITGQAGTARVEALEKQNEVLTKQVASLVEALADVKNEMYRLAQMVGATPRADQVMASFAGTLLQHAKNTKSTRSIN